jgi:hypothetical protein
MSTLPSAKERIAKGLGGDIVSNYSNLGTNNPFKGPTARSLFYEAGKRSPGKYGQFLFYSLGNNDNNFVDAYYKSENAEYNTRVSSLKSRNPSAGFLVRETNYLEAVSANTGGMLSGLNSSFERSIIGGLAAPYYWKDFLYCRYYGAIPNNYMITLRRFPTPVLDNLSAPNSVKASESYTKEGAARPVAQAVTWFGGNTDNKLSTLIEFTTGLAWTPKTQSDIVNQEAFSKGFFGDLPYKWFAGAARTATGTDTLANTIGSVTEGMVVAFDPNNTTIDDLRFQGLRDRAKGGANDDSKFGVMSEYIWTPVDVVKETQVRDTGLVFKWGQMDVIFEYDLTSVGEVNTKAAMLDIMGNLLSIGTNYGNFLTPDIRYSSNFPAFGFPGGDAGLATFYQDPLAFILAYGDKLTNPTGDAVKSVDTPAITGQLGGGGGGGADDSQLADLKAQLEKITSEGISVDKIKDLAKKFGSGFGKLLKLAVTEDMVTNLKVPMSLLTGAPVGEWHLTIGNPCNPIAMMGNLICKEVKVEFGDILGPDDFPTTLKATFTLEHGRDKERGEIESMFNRGDGRLYQTSQSTTSSLQSYNSFADTAGNVLSEQTKDNYLNGNPFGSPDNQQSPAGTP